MRVQSGVEQGSPTSNARYTPAALDTPTPALGLQPRATTDILEKGFFTAVFGDIPIYLNVNIVSREKNILAILKTSQSQSQP